MPSRAVRRWPILCMLALLALLPGGRARAAGPFCTVLGGGGPNDFTTIQAAVDDAGCATIQLGAGSYAEHVVIGRELALRGAGAERTAVEGQRGGVVFQLDFGAKASIDGITIRDGANSEGGAGIASSGALTLTNSIVTDNAGGSGGGISNRGTMLISNSLIISNTAQSSFLSNGSGAGIFNSGTLTILDSPIVSNTAEIDGGAIFNTANLTIVGSTIRANRTSQSIRGGGGIFHDGGVLTLHNVTIADNLTSAAGGGIYAQGNAIPSTVDLNNVTISGNRAGDGAAIYDNKNNTLYGAATLTIASTTIAGNSVTAPGGAGVQNQGTITFKNTIIAGSSGANCANSGVLQSNGFNLDSGATCGFTRNGDQANANPKLGPLRDNGGATLTHALLPGSPAIDAGTNVGCAGTDQRGALRPAAATTGAPRCDIGAYEYRAVPAIASLNPQSSRVGGPAFALAVNGSNFVQGATVRWNGAPRPTTFISSTQLIAQLGAGDTAKRQRALVTVLNPGPGDGESNAAVFSVGTSLYLPLARR